MAQICGGRLEREGPIDIYGAAAQQMLSVLLERNGAYRSVAELTDLFSDCPHLGRPILEQVLDRLAASHHVRAHGFQNRFGAGEKLYRLRDLRLVWGNFPSRSREIRLTTNGRQLGTIPASNLLRVRSSETIRFAGRYWLVRQVRPDSIEVEASRQSSGLELTYSGARASLDATNIEEMLRLLEAGISAPAMAPGTRDWFVATAERVRRHCSRDQIALARDERGYHYFTFAGQLDISLSRLLRSVEDRHPVREHGLKVNNRVDEGQVAEPKPESPVVSSTQPGGRPLPGKYRSPLTVPFSPWAADPTTLRDGYPLRSCG